MLHSEYCMVTLNGVALDAIPQGADIFFHLRLRRESLGIEIQRFTKLLSKGNFFLKSAKIQLQNLI